jgi:hypothetical protein
LNSTKLLTKACLVVSLALKNPIVTSLGCQLAFKKLTTKVKMSRAPLDI